MKQKSLFYKIYFAAVAVFAVLLITGLFIMHGRLADYEAAQPEPTVNRLIETKIKTGDIYSEREEYSLKLSPYETKESFNSALKELTNGKEITAASSSVKPKDCDVAYNIKAGDTVLFNVYLKKNGKTKKYAVSGLEFDSSVYKSFKITAPSDAEVKINGITVNPEDRADEKLPNIKSDLLKSDKLIKKQIITANDLLNKPESVTASSGGKELTVREDGGVYSVVQSFDEMKAVGDIAGKAASVYAEYMQNDSNLASVKKYIDSDTDFYTNIRKSLVMFVLEHQSYAIKDLTVTDYHKYSDDLFSCRVRLVNALNRNGAIYEDKFDKYVYLRRDGNTYKAIDMQNTGDSVK